MSFLVFGSGLADGGGMLLLPNSGGAATSYIPVSLPAPRGVRCSFAPLVAEGTTKGLLLAPAANRRLVRCALSHNDSHQAITAQPEGPLPAPKLRVPAAHYSRAHTQTEGQGRALSVPKGASLGWGVLLLPTSNRHTGVARCSPGTPPATFGEGQGALSVPKGASLGWGVLPTSNRHTGVARCSPGPPPATFGEIMCQELRVQMGEIPAKINCVPLVGHEDVLDEVALVGHEDVLDEVADSAQRIVTVIGNFTPQLVDMIYDRFIRQALPPQGLVGFLKSKALAIVVALEIVQAECKEGYVREDSLVKAITMVRAAALRLIPRTYVLPPQYSTIIPKTDKFHYFTALAMEIQELSVVLHEAMVDMLKKT